MPRSRKCGSAYAFHDLQSFVAVYYEGMSVLRSAQDFYDLATACFSKAHSETVVAGIHRAQQDAETSLGLRSQRIMCFLRDLSAESAMETLEHSLAHKDWIVGVGLDSDEKNNPPLKFKEVFARARREYSLEHVRQCLDEIGVERIDHGVNAAEDETLSDEIRAGAWA